MNLKRHLSFLKDTLVIHHLLLLLPPLIMQTDADLMMI